MALSLNAGSSTLADKNDFTFKAAARMLRPAACGAIAYAESNSDSRAFEAVSGCLTRGRNGYA